MRKTILFLSFLSFMFLASCSSVEGDAKKAAELNRKSLECVLDNDVDKAEKLFKESEEIANKYKGTDDYEEFQRIYLENIIKK